MNVLLLFALIHGAYGPSVALGDSSNEYALNFSDLPSIIDQTNQHVSGARAKRQGTNELTGYLTRSYLPHLSTQLGAEHFNSGPHPWKTQPYASIETRINLYRGGRDALEDDVRRAAAENSQADFERTRLEELTKARHAFWQLVYERELISLLNEAIKQNELNLIAANKRIRAGLATSTDRIEFEMYSIQLKQDLSRMSLGSANSQRTLNVLLGKPQSASIITPSVVPHDHKEAEASPLLKTELSIDQHRDVKALIASGNAVAAQKQQLLRWWTPSIDAYASHSLYTLREREYSLTADRYETVFGAQITMNLFDGLQSHAEASALGLQADGYAQQAEQTARELQAQFDGAKQELTLTHNLIAAAELGIKQGTEYLTRTQAEYSRGVKNSLDVLSATQKYVDLKRRYAELRHDYQQAKTALLATLGQ